MCGDIIQIRENITFECFAFGKDQGIDYRGFKNGKTIIVQVKSTKNYNTLKSELKNVELAKVKKLNPDRYILMVAMPLLPNQKKEILEIFKEYIVDNLDLIHGADIEGYLRRPEYSSVRKFFQQKAILNVVGPHEYKIVDDHPFVNCRWLYQDILELEKYYVETSCFERVKRRIEDNNNIIILTGDPGSGKTTNAKMLIAYLLDKKMADEVIVLKSYNDFFKYYDGEKRQIFFFDDFWGSTFRFNYFDSNIERDLFAMLDLVSTNSNSYLIMTTREYVLKQGLNALHIQGGREVERRIYHSNSDFTKLEKTKILISHVLNSNLDYNVISILLYNVDKITEMMNYSPRTISYYISQHHDMQASNGYDFYDDLMEYLNNPFGYFENIFYKLSKSSRIITYIMAISNPPIYIDKLKECFILFVDGMKDIKLRDFNLYVQELENTFTKFDNELRAIDFVNHSIHDFINEQLERDYLDYKKEIIHSIIYFNQYTNLLLSDDIDVDKENYKILIKRLMDNFDEMDLISVDGDELDIFDYPDMPFVWYNQKIWHSINIAEKYNDRIFMDFLVKKTLELIDYYLSADHSYEDKNYTAIPDLLKRFEKFGYEFDYKKIALKFFMGRKYLFEFACVKYGPEAFQKEIKNLFNENRNTIIPLLPEYLKLELEVLSEEGIGFEYDQLLDDFPDICTYFDIPYSKDLAKIIDGNKIKYVIHTHVSERDKVSELSPEERKTREYLKKVENSFYDEGLSKFEVLLEFEKADFKDEVMSKVCEELKNDRYDFIFDLVVSNEFLGLIFLYIRETGDVDLSWRLYPKLVEFIANKTGVSEIFLYDYAFYKDVDGSCMASKRHLSNNFSLTDKDINELIKIGVFKEIYKLVDFTDENFEKYLRVMYVVKADNNSFDDYKQYFNGVVAFLSSDYEMFEYFDTKNFNEIFLRRLFENITNDSYSVFKDKIFDIEFDCDNTSGYSYTLAYDDNYVMLSDLYVNFEGVLFEDELIDYIKKTKWFMSNNKTKIKISDFYNDNKDNKYGQHLNNLCMEYYNWAMEFYKKIIQANGKVIEF